MSTIDYSKFANIGDVEEEEERRVAAEEQERLMKEKRERRREEEGSSSEEDDDDLHPLFWDHIPEGSAMNDEQKMYMDAFDDMVSWYL